MHIPRHPIDKVHLSAMLTTYSDLVPWSLSVIETRDDLLSTLVDGGLAYAGVLAASGGPAPEIARFVRVAGRAGAALYVFARAEGKPLRLLVDDAPRTLAHRPPDNSTVHVARWLQAMWAAMAVGEPSAAALLASTPPQVWRASSTKTADCVDWLACALRAYATRDPAVEEMLMKSLRATDPSAIGFASPDWVLDIIVPALEVFFALLDGDARAFDASLEKALKLHAQYWGAGDRARNPDGYLSAPLASLMREARARGVPFRTTSDYAPPALVEAPISPAELLLCPYCLTPIVADAIVCPACLSDPRNDAPIEVRAEEYRHLPRKRCVTGDAYIIDLAVLCPSCRCRQ